MVGKSKHYYTGGHTAHGFYSLYDSNLRGLERVFILKGGPGTGKSTLIQRTGEQWQAKGYAIEWLHSASDYNAFDGVIIPQLKIGMVDGTAPRTFIPQAPGVIEEYVNLGAGWNSQKLAERKQEIIGLNRHIAQLYQSAYAAFAEALRVHDDWEKIYIENMDFERADVLKDELIETFFANQQLHKKSDVRHRFLGAATPRGAVDFIPELTEDVEKRYFLKGRPGSGKSTILKQIAANAEARGFDLEIYHCGFDPHSLDMLIMREAGIAIFDSTAPHEHFPSRDHDVIVDTYERTIRVGTDERYEQEIENVRNKYKGKMKEGISYLSQAKQKHDELKAYYVSAMDFGSVDQLREQIHHEIEERESMIRS